MADQIEKIIPGYRKTTWFKGIAQTGIGDYRGAVETLGRFLTYDRIEPSTYFHLLASQAMLDKADAMVETLRDFFVWQHRMLMRSRYKYLNLEKSIISFSKQSATNSTQPKIIEGETVLVAQISMPYLQRVVRLIADKHTLGYHQTLINTYLIVAGIFDELNFSDAELGYFETALKLGKLPSKMIDYIYGRFQFFYKSAKVLKDNEKKEGNTSRAARYHGFLKKYVQSMLKIKPTATLKREFELLKKEDGKSN